MKRPQLQENYAFTGEKFKYLYLENPPTQSPECFTSGNLLAARQISGVCVRYEMICVEGLRLWLWIGSGSGHLAAIWILQVVDPGRFYPGPDPTFQKKTGSGSNLPEKNRIRPSKNNPDPEPCQWVHQRAQCEENLALERPWLGAPATYGVSEIKMLK